MQGGNWTQCHLAPSGDVLELTLLRDDLGSLAQQPLEGLRAELRRIARQAEVRLVVVDLGALTAWGAKLIGLLVEFERELALRHCELHVRGDRYGVLQAVGLGHLTRRAP
jgi:hypothetical protein